MSKAREIGGALLRARDPEAIPARTRRAAFDPARASIRRIGAARSMNRASGKAAG